MGFIKEIQPDMERIVKDVLEEYLVKPGMEKSIILMKVENIITIFNMVMLEL